MHLASRLFVIALMVALLGAQSLPCGITQADAWQSRADATQTLSKARGHLSHAHGAMAHADSDEECDHDAHPSLRAYCVCGCSDTAKSNIPAYRLGFSLVSIAPEMIDPIEVSEPLWPASNTLPAGPLFAIEHVPLAV